MKIKEGFVLRQVADQWMAVPIGSMAEKVHGLIALNETGADIWKILQEDHTEEEVVDILMASYESDREEVGQSVKEFISSLQESDILDK
ncbi:PqqD family protein [Massilistercora timonensis]|uniref:PqqD family protein n=1 Tax=Massilistercora timonensis TaxID=2086584 RepID=UPI000D0EE1BD|nr:PqqD family protein [Massilistercora timonensis]